MDRSEHYNFLTTKGLVAAANGGDRDALESLFVRYLPRVRQIVALRLGFSVSGRAVIEDLVQDALVGVLENLERFERRSEGSFTNWLSVCVANSVRDHFRKSGALKRGGRRNPVSAGDFADVAAAVLKGKHPTPSTVAEGSELASKIATALLKLSEHHREVIILHRLCGMPHREVAEELGFGSAASVRKALSRALERLEDLLGEDGRQGDGS